MRVTRFYPKPLGSLIYGGKVTPSVGGLIAAVNLVNESAAEQAGGFVTPMFGHPFQQGDIPAGQWPAFETEDGVPCPYTAWGRTSWPDGSLKWLGFMVRFPQNIPGLGTKPLRMLGGGGVPTSGSRSLSDVTAADLKIELTGVTNLSGLWTGALNTAITDAIEITNYCNGPAGAIWRVRGNFKQSGSAHGQIVDYHYIAAMQNSGSGLLGLRYLGKVAQPWGDVTSPAPARRVVTAVLKSGATTIRTLAGLNTNETIGANIAIPHYTAFFTAGADAKWDYVQGGGSAAADCTVRVVHDKAYVIATRMTPPYSTTLSPTSSGSQNYYPGCSGGMTRDMGGTGERADIGVLTSWAVRHLMTQSAVDLRVICTIGLASGGWRTTLRRASTGQPVAVADISASYAGLGPVQPFWRYYPGSSVEGFQDPAGNTTLWASETEPSHRPSATYYPYLVTARPEMLDMLVEQAMGLFSATIGGSRSANTTPPITNTTLFSNADYGERDIFIGGTRYKGGAWMFIGGLTRVQAWMLRDLSHAAGIYPDTCPYGTEVRKYIREVRDAGLNAINVYNAAFGSPWNTSGMYNFDNRLGANNPWCQGFMSNAACLAASVHPTDVAVTFRQHLSRHWSDIAAVADIASAISYLGLSFDENFIRVNTSGEMLFYIPTTLTFSTTTSRFTVGGLLGSWNPTNGDVIALDTSPTDQFPGSTKPFAAAVDRRKLYVVGASGNSAALSLTPGGAPITVTTNVAVAGIWGRLQNLSPHVMAGNDTANDGYLASISAAIRHHRAVGDTVINAAEADVTALLTTAGTSFVSDPKNALVASYPG